MKIEKIRQCFEEPSRVILWLAAKGAFNFMSDETYLRMMYRIKMKSSLHISNPQTFNEKLQWLKLHDRRPEYTKMVDKYEAKRYIADMLGEEYIIPTLGVWDRFEDIDFDCLPDQFVLKCTHDSGGLVICKDKTLFDMDGAKQKLEQSLKNNYFWNSREWPYKNVKPRIIAENYMSELGSSGLVDYKFFCFNGEVKMVYVSKGLDYHPSAAISFLTLDWQFAPFKRSDYKPFDRLPKRPNQFEKMIGISKQLSKDISFLRVDLYEIDGNIYFSELTFFPCSGFLPFDPIEWDKEIGTWLDLPQDALSAY